MTKDDIIRMAREAELPACHTTHPKALARFAAFVAAAEREKLNDEANIVAATLKNLKLRIKEAVAAEREKVAKWMIQRSYATGHGDTIEDLLVELEWQIKERIAIEREACAKVCGELASDAAKNQDFHALSALEEAEESIRARGQNV